MTASNLKAATLLFAMSAIAPVAHALANPLDAAGAEHNRQLACLLDAGGPPADKVLDVLVDVCGYVPQLPREEFVKKLRPAMDADYAVPLVKLMDAERGRYSAYEFSFFERMDAVLEHAGNWEEVDAQLAVLEREAIEKLDSKSEAGQAVLGGLSVGRYSAVFWSQVEGRLGNGVARKGWFGRLMAVVGADLKSYVSTFSVGGAAGASAVAGVKEIGEAGGWW